MKLGILITGNEVLYAKTRDTNGPYMASLLAQKGITIVASLTCADSRLELQDCLTYLARKCDAIVMTGGLGPTSDDLTAEVVAGFFGLSQEFNNEAWAHCVDIFTRLGRKQIPDTNRKQALLPKGATILPNPNGTAVGFCTRRFIKELGKSLDVYSLPGVPHECEPMFSQFVLPKLLPSSSEPVSRVWQVFAMGESNLQAAVNELEVQIELKFPTAVISYQAHSGYVTYTLSLIPQNQEQQQDFVGFLNSVAEPFFKKAVGHRVAYRTPQPVSAFLVSSFSEAGRFLTFAESCTGGLLAKEVCANSGSSKMFYGSIVAYSNTCKRELLKVSNALLEKKGAVSQEVACAMAKGALEIFASDVSVGVTGIAGPTGGSVEKPVGTVYFGISLRKTAFLNPSAISELLQSFGWAEDAEQNTQDVLTFGCQQKFGIHQQRVVVQNRSAVYALCTVALLVPFLLHE